jgi:3-hydroxybutyryl-CoA dehydrogenase
MNITTAGVIGAGTMGLGIAQILAQSGRQVFLAEVSLHARAVALEKIADSLSKLRHKGTLTEAEQASTLGRIRLFASLESFCECQLVVEAVSENTAIKQSLFESLDRICPTDSILASNTSSLPLTRIAAWSRNPERVIGMHFMNPVPLMPLVEIVRALQTGDAAWQTVESLARDLGKTPVTVRDAPGFVSNRVLMPMINEAIFALHDNVAEVEAIDSVMRLGMHHPMGPLALADLIGLDTCLSVMNVLYQSFQDSKYRACPLLAQMVAAGRLGRKSGQGFYAY